MPSLGRELRQKRQLSVLRHEKTYWQPWIHGFHLYRLVSIFKVVWASFSQSSPTLLPSLHSPLPPLPSISPSFPTLHSPLLPHPPPKKNCRARSQDLSCFLFSLFQGYLLFSTSCVSGFVRQPSKKKNCKAKNVLQMWNLMTMITII